MQRFYERNYFLIRRLHSLSGIIPVGAFFLIHMLLNSRASQSAKAYQWVPDTLDQVPFIWIIEIAFIIVPILFHGVLGWFIIWGGDPNSHKPALGWYENWAYTLQRWTGGILFVLILIHLWQTWWVHMSVKLTNSLNKTNTEFDIFGLMAGLLKSPLMIVAYALFVLIAAYHFGNGVFNFLYKWGVTTSKQSQRWAIAGGLLIGLIGVFLGFASLWGFILSPWAMRWAASLGQFIAAR